MAQFDPWCCSGIRRTRTSRSLKSLCSECVKTTCPRPTTVGVATQDHVGCDVSKTSEGSRAGQREQVNLGLERHRTGCIPGAAAGGGGFRPRAPTEEQLGRAIRSGSLHPVRQAAVLLTLQAGQTQGATSAVTAEQLEALAVVLVDVSIGVKGEALDEGAAAFARWALARRKRQAVLERSGERQFVSAKEGCASSSSSPRFFNRRTVRLATVSSNALTSSSSGGGSGWKGAVLVVSRAGATKRLSGH